tara:strand:+ start:7977 stop:8276 length:300 start_codon:yes stop_codon:yes gene_type:complete
MNKASILREADEIARNNDFSEETLLRCQDNILRWLRYHKLAPLYESEAVAIIILQRNVRKWLVRKKLYVHFNMLLNLCKNGAQRYVEDAQVYHMLISKK